MNHLLLLALLLIPSLALADKDKGKNNVVVGARASGLSLEREQGSVGVGLAVRLRVTPKWSIEGTADLLQNKVVQTVAPLSVGVIRYILPDARVSLYGVGGVGFSLLRDEGSIAREIDQSRLFGSVGFGAEARINKVVVAADLRYLVMDKSAGQTAAGSFAFDRADGGVLSVMVGRAF